MNDETAIDGLPVDEVLDGIRDVFYVLDEDGHLVEWNRRLSEVSGYDEATVAGMSPEEFFVPDDRERVREAVETVLAENREVTVDATLETSDGERVPFELTGTPLTDASGAVVGLAGTGRDVSRLRHHQRELERLNRVNAVIRDVHAILLRSRDRRALQNRVCQRLAADPAYAMACVGAELHATDTVAPQAWAGRSDAFLGEVTFRIDGTGATADPVGRTFVTGRTQVVDDFETATVEWARQARERGYGSCIAVPLASEGLVLGVLAVFAEESGVFDGEERTILGELGESVGYVLDSLSRRRAHVGGDHVELRFRVPDRSHPLCGAVTGGSATLELRDLAVVENGTPHTLVYARSSGLEEEAALGLAEGNDVIDHVRIVDRRDGTLSLELRLDEGALPLRVAERGGRLDSVVVDPEGFTAAVLVPESLDVGTAVDLVQQAWPSAALVFQQTRRGEEGPRADLQSVLGSLTDRQRSVLETAYFAGYFGRERQVTGTELAESLGISAATFHEHLRTAQRKLLEATLDRKSRTTPPGPHQ